MAITNYKVAANHHTTHGINKSRWPSGLLESVCFKLNPAWAGFQGVKT